MADINKDWQPVIIRAFITNPELNTDEVSAGIWQTFPTMAEELQKALAAIRLDGVIHKRYSVDDYDTDMVGLSNALPSNPDLDELNYLAMRLSEMGEDCRMVFETAMQSGGFQTMRDIINVTENTDCFELQPAHSAEAYGEFLKSGHEEYFASNINALKNSDDASDREFAEYIEGLESCIDMEAYGMRKAQEENGRFVSSGYLTRTDKDFVELYNTPSDIPSHCRVFTYPSAELIDEAIGAKPQPNDSPANHQAGRTSVIDRLIQKKQHERQEAAQLPSSPARHDGPHR